MDRKIELKDGTIVESANHLIISLYMDCCTANLGLSYYSLFAMPRDKANDYITYSIERLQNGQMSC